MMARDRNRSPKMPWTTTIGIQNDASVVRFGAAASGSTIRQQLHGRRVHAGVAGGDDLAAVNGGATVPRRHSAASLLDDGDQRDDVDGFQAGFDNEINLAGGEHAIGIAIATVSRHSYCVPHAAKCRSLGR